MATEDFAINITDYRYGGLPSASRVLRINQHACYGKNPYTEREVLVTTS